VPSYLSPENSHVIESLSNRRQKGENERNGSDVPSID
jgi:hypothetical protein